MISKKTSPRLDRYFEDYSACHRNFVNKLTHYVGIPMILISLLGLLSTLQIPTFDTLNEGFLRLDGGVILWSLAVLWYCFLDWRLALPFSLVGAGCYFISREIPIAGNILMFGIGWTLQLVGHYLFEKKSPAFMKNLMQLLIGPLWLFAKTIGYGK